jgi:lantibiotic biosynthesis protein
MARAACVYDALSLSLVAGRTPLLPLRAVTEIFSAPEPLHALRALLEREPLVRHAIYIASPALFEAADAWLSGAPLRNRSVPLRILAYLDRMASRCTPFGLCAGIGIIEVGDSTTLLVDDEARRTFTRPDMGLLWDVVKALESGRHREAIRYRTNSAAFERGGRLYVTNVELTSTTYTAAEFVTEQRPVSLKNTAAVKFVREFAKQAQPYALLAAKLAERFEASTEDSNNLLDRLIEAGVLISELRASPVGAPVAYLLERFNSIDRDTARRVENALRAAAELDEKSLRERTTDEYRSVALQFSRLVEKAPAHSVQVDLKSPFKGHLSATVLRDVARLGEYWRRMAPIGTLGKFRQRFVNRYEGVERMVPLLELVDPNLGLGVPEGVEAEETDRSERDRAAIRIACDALRSGAVEVALQETDVEALMPPLTRDSAIESMEVGFQIVAPSRESIDAGDYVIVPSSLGGSDRATRSLGRFANLLGENVRERIRAVARASERHNGLVAEFVFAPPEPRSYNVSIRPPIFDAELRVGIGEPCKIDELFPDDLWVGLENGRFFLWSHSRRCRVIPRETHLFATSHNAPNLCRFLATIASDGRRLVSGFDWGAAARLTYLPRVRIGRIVLSLRRWRFNAKDVTKSPDEAARSLRRWREVWQLPRYVMLAEADNQLLLDLESPVAGALVFDQVEAHADIVELVEALPEPGQTWLQSEGDGYAAELVASLLPNRQPTASGSAAPVVMTGRRRFGPGSDWLYAKFFMGAQAVDDFILRAIAPLVSDLREAGRIDRWFFVRYADPQPHVRVRIRSVPGAKNFIRDRIVTAGEEWLSQDRVLRYALDTYDPEYERYGGSECLDLMERFFTSDSDLCLELLGGMPDSADGRIKTSVESFYPWLLGGNLRETALNALNTGSQRKIPAADRTELKRMTSYPPEERQSTELERACSGSNGADMLASAFHMHCNRLGLDGDCEARAAALLRALIISSAARSKPHAAL